MSYMSWIGILYVYLNVYVHENEIINDLKLLIATTMHTILAGFIQSNILINQLCYLFIFVLLSLTLKIYSVIWSTFCTKHQLCSAT